MALTRKFLSALGIEADKVDEIIEAHSETVNALKKERDDLKDKAESAEELQKKLDEANEALENANGDGYKSKYETLKKEYEDFKASEEEKATTATKEKAYRQILTDAGVSSKRLDSIMKLTDLKELELDGDGLKDADKIKESVKKEWADFIVTQDKEGAGVENPPAGGDGGNASASIPTIF